MKAGERLKQSSFRQRRPILTLLFIFGSSLLFLLLQGGKLASMLFAVISIVTVYLLLGYWSGIRHVHAERFIRNNRENVLQAGQSLTVNLQIHVPGIWPIPYVLIQETLVRNNGNHCVMETSLVLNWSRNGEVTFTTPPLRRGVYQFAPTEFVTEDIFGLLQHKGTKHLPGQLMVMPETIYLKEWVYASQFHKGNLYQAGQHRYSKETTQINGIREYIHGDRLSRIHWNATAKTGTWKSKEYERESLPKFIIVLDRRKQAYKDEEEFELAVSIAASLIQFAERNREAVGFLSEGVDSFYAEPLTGREHYTKLNHHLAGVEADGSVPLLETMQRNKTVWSPGILVAVISAQAAASSLEAAVWAKQEKMVPLYICTRTPSTASSNQWINEMRREGLSVYGITRLQDLPDALRGVKQYA